MRDVVRRPPAPRSGSAVAGVVSPAPREAWRSAFARTDGALLTQAPEWASCLSATGRWRDVSRLYELRDGRYLVLPLVSRGVGPLSVAGSWPYGWGYGGVLASDGRVSQEDLVAVSSDLSRVGAARLSIHPSPFDAQWDRSLGARVRTRYLTQVLDLGAGLPDVWKRYSTNVRRSVRRAERSGLELVRDDSGALLSTFAGLYRKSVERWARDAGRSTAVARLHSRLQEPPDNLAAISSVMGRACVVRAAFLHGTPVAAVILLQGADHTLYWRGAMDRDLAARTHANALLHHLAIEEAAAAGHRTYSFGESDEGSALAEYKAKFGARPLQWTAHHFEPIPVTAPLGVARRTAILASRAAARTRGGTG